MSDIDKHPKCIVKVLRYINQDATKEQLAEIKKLIDGAIRRRTKTIN